MATGIERNLRRARGARGSVLVETVLAFPLFLILLGGILWSLELMLKRIDLMERERRGAWSVRHDRAAPEESTVEVALIGDWYAQVQATAEDEAIMPEWIQGMFKPAEILQGAQPVQTTLQVPGRERGSGGHHVVMRASSELGLRAEPGEVVGSGQWTTIYHQPWLDEAAAPEALDAPPTTFAHERHRGFVRYSK